MVTRFVQNVAGVFLLNYLICPKYYWICSKQYWPVLTMTGCVLNMAGFVINMTASVISDWICQIHLEELSKDLLCTCFLHFFSFFLYTSKQFDFNFNLSCLIVTKHIQYFLVQVIQESIQFSLSRSQTTPEMYEITFGLCHKTSYMSRHFLLLHF